jgi:hydrogenase expression/formation protein HypE
MIWKTDPITFETSNPGRYGVIVNLNDLTCMGAIPHSMLVTWLLPTTLSIEELNSNQQEIQKAASEFGAIEIVGGHTEWTSAVKSPIVSITMIGFTPHSYLPSRSLKAGDSVYLLGFLGNEGTSILVSKMRQFLKNNQKQNFQKYVPKDLYDLFHDHSKNEELDQFERLLSIHKDGLQINKTCIASLMHDPTEGGLFGALSEIFVDRTDCGVRIDSISLQMHLHPVTKSICEWLNVDPCK